MTYTLHLGDCLEVLPTLEAGSVDAVITDPPYATTGTETSWVSRDGKRAHPRETQFYEAWLREHLAEWRRVLKPTGAIWFTCDWHAAMSAEMACYRLGIKTPIVGVWYRQGLGMGYLLRHVYECFVVIPMVQFERRATDEPDLWVYQWTPGDRKTGHSGEKPVELMARAIRLLTPIGGVVLDPFVGSGSTGVAAVQTGRDFIGIDREQDNCDLARARIDKAASQARQPELLEVAA